MTDEDFVLAVSPGRAGPAGLADLVQECTRSGVPRSALLLSAHRMPADLMRPHHLRLAHQALAPLASADRGQVFDLPGGSRVVTWRGDADPLLVHVLATLTHLFAGEPAIADITTLAKVYALPHQGQQLLAAVRATTPGPAELPRKTIKTVEKLDPTSLQNLEQALAQVNVTRFARHRRVWRVVQDSRLEIAWDKRFLSIPELTDSLLPGYDATADPWLFRRLTRTLDRRLLSLLGAPDELRACGPFSLDLNVSTMLSPEFLRFDAALPSHLRGKLVIDLLAADILADPAGYIFARGFVRARNYRIMIREVSAALFTALDFKALDPDLVELEFASQMPENLPQRPELVLAYSNNSGAIDQAARVYAAAHAIRLLTPRD